jgi:hypothetical protein
VLLLLLVVDVLRYNRTFELDRHITPYQSLLVTTLSCDTTILVHVAVLREAWPVIFLFPCTLQYALSADLTPPRIQPSPLRRSRESGTVDTRRLPRLVDSTSFIVLRAIVLRPINLAEPVTILAVKPAQTIPMRARLPGVARGFRVLRKDKVVALIVWSDSARFYAEVVAEDGDLLDGAARGARRHSVHFLVGHRGEGKNAIARIQGDGSDEVSHAHFDVQLHEVPERVEHCVAWRIC